MGDVVPFSGDKAKEMTVESAVQRLRVASSQFEIDECLAWIESNPQTPPAGLDELLTFVLDLFLGEKYVPKQTLLNFMIKMLPSLEADPILLKKWCDKIESDCFAVFQSDAVLAQLSSIRTRFAQVT